MYQYKYTHTRTCMPMYTYMCISCIYVYINVHMFTHAHAHARAHMYVHTHICIRIHTSGYHWTYRFVHIHLLIHTYINICTYTCTDQNIQKNAFGCLCCFPKYYLVLAGSTNRCGLSIAVGNEPCRIHKFKMQVKTNARKLSV